MFSYYSVERESQNSGEPQEKLYWDYKKKLSDTGNFQFLYVKFEQYASLRHFKNRKMEEKNRVVEAKDCGRVDKHEARDRQRFFVSTST